MISSAIKPFRPQIRKELEKGALDNFLNRLCSDCAEKYNINLEFETVEFMISKELIDSKNAYIVSFVALNSENVIRPLESMNLSELILLILNEL